MKGGTRRTIPNPTFSALFGQRKLCYTTLTTKTTGDYRR